MSKSPITTHVLDTATGFPAQGINAVLSQLIDGNFVEIDGGTTNEDGRITDLLMGKQLTAGTYQMHFALTDYFADKNTDSFYPYADIVFNVKDINCHYHIPLLLSPFGYSTYRGS